MKMVIVVLAVLILALTAIPAHAGHTYTVQEGDMSLWCIADDLGISFGALLDANWELENPDLIYVGDVILLP